MIGSGLILLGAYGTYQSYQALHLLEERRRRIPIYRYQNNEDFTKYIQPSHLHLPFILHVHPDNIQDKEIPIGLVKVFFPNLHFHIRNRTGENSSIHLDANNIFEGSATIPLTSSLGVEVKNQWKEAFSKTINCNLNKSNIIIPTKGFRTIFPPTEVIDLATIGTIPVMEDEYYQLTQEKISFSSLTNSNVKIWKQLFNVHIRGLYYYGQIDHQASQNEYQNLPLEASAKQKLDQEGTLIKKDVMATKYLASHMSTDKQKLVEELYQDEQTGYELLMGCSIGSIMVGGVLVLVSNVN